MDTPAETIILDRDDVKALRNADAIAFRHTPEGSTIECIKKDRDEYGEKERRREITVLGTVFNGYDSDGGRSRGEEMHYGFAYFGSAQYTESWRTVASLLKVGDNLRLEFRTDDGTNGYAKTAGLHVDELYLRVERAGKRLYFLLDVSVCQNNSARMCRATR